MKTLNEEINRIKSIMGILREEETPTNSKSNKMSKAQKRHARKNVK